MDKITFQSKDGTKLAGVWHLPGQHTDKAIILVHGITVDKDESGVFVRLADTLSDMGYAVFRFDFRGHGESEGRSVDMTIENELIDLYAAYRLVSTKGYKHIGLMGASFGGGITALFTGQNQDKLVCACLWNPVLNYDHCFLNPTVPWIQSRKDHMKTDIAQKGWTTLGSKNFIIGKNLFNDMSKLFPYKTIQTLTIPLLIIHGNKDTKVPFEDSQTYAANLKQGQFAAIEGAEHGFHEEPFETQAINITADFFKKNL